MKCDNCKNKDICKHVEYMEKTEQMVKNLYTKEDAPISIETICESYCDKNIQIIKPFDFSTSLFGYPYDICKTKTKGKITSTF